MSFHLLALNRSLMRFRCREDMQFGIIFLHCLIHPSPSEPSHAGHALKLVKQSRLKSNALFATFASEATGTVKYGFDGSVASFQETSGQALKMFDIALRNPVRLDPLLEELQTISEVATNKNGKLALLRHRGSMTLKYLGQSGGIRKD